MLIRKPRFCNIYNISNKNLYTNLEILDILESILKKKFKKVVVKKIIFKELSCNNIDILKCDDDCHFKTFNELNWKANVSMSNTLQELFDIWYTNEFHINS